MGRQIEYPDDMAFMKLAKDTVAFPFEGSDYKVLVYVDSTGCTSCKLQLQRWKNLMSQTDSLKDKRISYLFVFQTKDQNELQYLLKRDNFNIPVVMDADDSFNKRNKKGVSAISLKIKNRNSRVILFQSQEERR